MNIAQALIRKLIGFNRINYSEESPVAYSLEVMPDRTILGIKAFKQEPAFWVIDEPLDDVTIDNINDCLNAGTEMVGFGNLAHDTYILEEVLTGATPEALFKLSTTLKKYKVKGLQKVNGMKPLPYCELDLENFSGRSSLTGFAEISSRLSILFCAEEDQPSESLTAMFISNLKEFLEAIEKERIECKDEVLARSELQRMYDLPGLLHMTPSVVAAQVMVEQYRRAQPEISLAEIEAVVASKRNSTFNLRIAETTRAYIKGTEAEHIADVIDGCTFKVAEGVLEPMGEAWNEHMHAISDMLSMYKYAPLDSQMENVYCSLSLTADQLRARWHSPSLLSCAPSHLEEGIFNALCGDLNFQYEQSRSNPYYGLYQTAALVWFGVIDALNDCNSLLYSPEKYMQILVHCDLVDLADQERKVNCHAEKGALHG